LYYYGRQGSLELPEVNLSVTTSFNAADDGYQLVVGRIKSVLVQEPVQVEVAHFSLALAVDEVESCLVIPVWALEQRLLQHFLLDVEIDLPLEVVSHGFLNGRMKFLSVLYVYLVSLPLAHIFAHLLFVARQNEL